MAIRTPPTSRQIISSVSEPVNSSPSYPISSRSEQFLETSGQTPEPPAVSLVRSKYQYLDNEPLNLGRMKENVMVTVRFRPLSPREIRQGDSVAWYADGDTIARNEQSPSVAYAYDRVFGPTTTTRHVYDVAGQHVINGAMEGVNGTIFAYGVTSSGKTHTMHGDQRSPGIIPLAVKDAFSIIQETPSRQFLIRVSYLEIYNEVVNDLLNPTGHNLRIREDHQAMYVEGLKEEIVLSPAHALSLIAAGEAHRHVGSNNFNLQSSRSHTIFTLLIESSPCGDDGCVNLSQLNLIDLAGSESSRTDTNGVRRKEGSYINKSLLTLGTVIAKLTDGRAAHIPYRDSKLTRLLQSSLSGRGRISLICTITPSSNNAEESHNTLKFAHRAKHVEIHASQNKIINEKSLIKKYQHEIQVLKEELEQLKSGIMTVSPRKDVGEDDLILLRQRLEDGQFRLQSRLEQEEEAKAALLQRIQRLTKLILVSTKTSQPSNFSVHPALRRRHSFGEEELAYLPHKRRDLMLDEDNVDGSFSSDGGGDGRVDNGLDEKRGRKQSLLNWFKLRKRESGQLDDDKLGGTVSSPSSTSAEIISFHTKPAGSNSLCAGNAGRTAFLLEALHDMEASDTNLPLDGVLLTSSKTADHIDLLKEQVKILFGEVALHSSTLKRLPEEPINNPKREEIQMEITKLNDEIKVKNQQIASLEKPMNSCIPILENGIDGMKSPQSYTELMTQLNEKSLELEVKAADNRIIQEQLQQKMRECEGLQAVVCSLKEQLSETLELKSSCLITNPEFQLDLGIDKFHKLTECRNDEIMPESYKVQKLRQRVTELTEANQQLESKNRKLAEESSYAKGLASAAATELKALTEEVSKLMSQKQRLTTELARGSNQRKVGSGIKNGRKENNIRKAE